MACLLAPRVSGYAQVLFDPPEAQWYVPEALLQVPGLYQSPFSVPSPVSWTNMSCLLMVFWHSALQGTIGPLYQWPLKCQDDAREAVKWGLKLEGSQHTVGWINVHCRSFRLMGRWCLPLNSTIYPATVGSWFLVG